jgi:CheY-like chemotaxis protein
LLTDIRKIKVLVIDNNPVFLKVFVKLLEIKGFNVTAETIFKMGLKHLKNKLYSIVFVDAP